MSIERLKTTGLIGLTGLATTGKDLVCAKMGDRGPVKRVALADNLKKDCRAFLMDKFGIDVNSCSPSEKELIRPLLVAFGKVRRVQSKGTFWTSQVTDDVIESSKTSLVIVTDIRYCDPSFENDEVFWLKKLGGKLIHIKRHTIVNGEKIYVKPPNEDEAKFDPLLQSHADFCIDWPTCLEDKVMLNYHIDLLVRYVNDNR